MPQVLRRSPAPAPIPREPGTVSDVNRELLPAPASDPKKPDSGIDPALFRSLSAAEYDALVDYAIEIGIENGFVQEGGTVSPSYIPVFDGTGIRRGTYALQCLISSCRGTSCIR